MYYDVFLQLFFSVLLSRVCLLGIFLRNKPLCFFTLFIYVPVCGEFYNFKVFCFKCFLVFTFIGPFQPSYDMMLTFYSYFKQASEGKCTRPKPWAWDIVNKKKWFATL